MAAGPLRSHEGKTKVDIWDKCLSPSQMEQGADGCALHALFLSVFWRLPLFESSPSGVSPVSPPQLYASGHGAPPANPQNQLWFNY